MENPPDSILEINSSDSTIEGGSSQKIKLNKVLITSLIVIIVMISIGFYLENIILTNNNSINKTTKVNNATNTTSSWPQVQLNHKVIFIGLNYVLNISNTDGSTIQPFNKNLTNGYTNTTTPSISPDHNKMFFNLGNSSLEKSYIVSLDGSKYEEIDEGSITQALGTQYSISLQKWSSDSNGITFVARDMKNFTGNIDQCCEGGDNRISKEIMGIYNINTKGFSKLYSLTSEAVTILYYDPIKQILVYQDSQGIVHSEDLKQLKEITEWNPSSDILLSNESNNNQYYLTESFTQPDTKDNACSRTLNIYSYYSIGNPIANINLNEPQGKCFTNWVIWSPNDKYFAIKVLNNDNSNSDLVKIYDLTGKLVLSIDIPEISNGSAFSSNERYFLAQSTFTSGLSNSYNGWRKLDISTGKWLTNWVYSTYLGNIIYWSN